MSTRKVQLLFALCLGFLTVAGTSATLGALEGGLPAEATRDRAANRFEHSGTDDVSSSLYLPLIAGRFDSGLGTPVFGIQIYRNGGPGSKYFTRTIQSNTSWLRVPVEWRQLEPYNVSPDSYYWPAFDPSAATALTDGIKLIFTCGYAPAWAAEYPNGPINAENYDDFAEFVGAMVERYDGDGQDDMPGSPVINHWEFYNEPDAGNGDVREHSSYWGSFGSDYAHMLSVAYAAARAADSNAQIVFGGLAYDWFEDQGGPFVRDFLDDVLAAGGGQYFDMMNFHAYPAFSTNWAVRGPGLLQKTEFIRSKLRDYGLDKPIINTEAGWHSNDSPGFPGSPEIQARYVVELFTQSMAGDIQVMIWWTMYDLESYYYENGLLTKDAVPKPSYYAFQTISSELGTTHFERQLTLAETGASEMEAYEFIDRVHNRMVYVAWLDPVDSIEVRSLRLAAPQVTVRDIYGNSHIANDGGDGILDGWVTIPISGQPVYVEKAL